MTEDPVLTTAQTAKYLNVSPVTLARWRKAGTGPDWSQPALKILYRQSDIDAWVSASRPTKSTEAATA